MRSPPQVSLLPLCLAVVACAGQTNQGTSTTSASAPPEGATSANALPVGMIEEEPTTIPNLPLDRLVEAWSAQSTVSGTLTNGDVLVQTREAGHSIVDGLTGAAVSAFPNVYSPTAARLVFAGSHVALQYSTALRSFDSKKGLETWSLPTSELSVISGFHSAYGDLVLATAGGDLVAIQASSGAIAWRTRPRCIVDPSTPSTFTPHHILFHACGGIDAYNAATGENEWSQPAAPFFAANDDIVAGVSKDHDDRRVVVWDTRSGAVLGQYPCPYPGPALGENPYHVKIALLNRTLVVSELFDRVMFGFDLDKGVIAWTLDEYATMAAVADDAIFTSSGNLIHGIDSTGTIRFRQSFGSRLISGLNVLPGLAGGPGLAVQSGDGLTVFKRSQTELVRGTATVMGTVMANHKPAQNQPVRVGDVEVRTDGAGHFRAEIPVVGTVEVSANLIGLAPLAPRAPDLGACIRTCSAAYSSKLITPEIGETYQIDLDVVAEWRCCPDK